MTFFDRILSTIRRKPKAKGAFGGTTKNWGKYKTLRVIPRSKRTPENCNTSGCQIDENFLKEKENKNA